MGCFEKGYSDALKGVLDFEVVEKRGRWQPTMTWKRQVEEYTDQI